MRSKISPFPAHACNNARVAFDKKRFRRWQIVFMLCSVGMLSVMQTAAAQPRKLELKLNIIQGYVGPYCMDVEHSSTSSGDNVEVDACDQSESQIWDFVQVNSTYYKIVSRHSGLCLDVKGASTSPGRNIQQFGCHGGDNQLWEKVYSSGYLSLKNKNSGLCASVIIGPGAGGIIPKQLRKLEQQACTNSDERLWEEVTIFCGNNYCGDFGESCSTCARDCGTCPSFCGNGICEVGETCPGCSDCGPCACPDGICSFYESCDTCSQDCGPCSCVNDGVCTLEEQAGGCPDCCGGPGLPGCQ